MAQTKSRNQRSSSNASSRSTKGSKARSSSNGRSTRASSTRARSTGNSSRASKSRSGGSSSSRSSKQTQSRSSSPARNAQRNGQGKSKVQSIAEKAKVPAMAGGAALVGLAGGAALKARQQRRRGLLSKMPTPNVDLSKLKPSNVSLPKPDQALKAIGSAAGQVSEKSRKVGQVADDVQRASDALNNNKR